MYKLTDSSLKRDEFGSIGVRIKLKNNNNRITLEGGGGNKRTGTELLNNEKNC